MALSWNEIRTRAIQFSKEYENETSENAEAKSFWDDFFNVFGIKRRRVATFEYKVTKGNRKDGFIDLLWKGHLLIEHKSSGKDLGRAYMQATDYFPGLREHELPKYVLVCNFQNFKLYDLEENTNTQFPLVELSKNVQLFGFVAGYQKRVFKDEDPVNIHAAEKMGQLHDKLLEVGFSGHELEVYLVRLLFCMFADDTSIFEKGIFEEYIAQNTKEDGSDVGAHISTIFEVLNKPRDKRLTNLDVSLAQFPYVNGKLFEEKLSTASFDSEMRNLFLQCCSLDWGKISPAIFGSLFQSVMNPEDRRTMGAHYTSEKNILKLITPLFLDDLWKEFESIKDNTSKLHKFHDKIADIRFLDPACGCGNFLVITYRELRLLEIEIIKTLQKGHMVTDISNLIKIDVDKFYGIEFEEFPAQIAQVAMWLIDHQMNMHISEIFGDYFIRLPLGKSAVIKHNNSLRINWSDIIDEKNPNYFNYILGNPPFVGKQYRNHEQKRDMDLVFANIDGSGVLDYVCCWYLRAAQYMIQAEAFGVNTKTAFVSTNSITQGEQPGVLWGILRQQYNISIHFAHRTFSWSSEAKGKAAVHCVIIGFAIYESKNKEIFEYHDIKGDPVQRKAQNINSYLVDAKDVNIIKRREPICNVPNMIKGSMPNDGGFYLFDSNEKALFLEAEPEAERYFKQFMGGFELINSVDRWCLWLKDADPKTTRGLKHVMDRIEQVKQYRSQSKRITTQKDASTPMLFGEIRQPMSDYLALPEVSSENRSYIPIRYVSKDVIASNKLYLIPNANLYMFGVLNSKMHMSWVQNVCGRMKSDFQYSTGIVYNNFPWPFAPTEKQVNTIEQAAQGVLNARDEYPNNSLGDLYNRLTMPPKLVKAHQALDRAVELAYRPKPFLSDSNRIEYLFEQYEKYTANLFTKLKIKVNRKK